MFLSKHWYSRYPRTKIRLLHCVFLGAAIASNSSLSSEALTESWSTTTSESWIFTGGYTYFDQNLDVIDYLESLEGSSRPQKYSQSAVSLAYKSEIWRPFIEYREVSGSVERASQPFEVESNAEYWGVGLAYARGDTDNGGSAVFQLTSATQDDVTIDCYERSGVVLGGACEEADFQLIDGDLLLETGDTVAYPVLTSSAEALSAELALNSWRRWSSYPILLGHTLKITASEVEHDSYSPLYDLQSSFLLNTPFNGKTLGALISELQDDLPQQSPWQEAVIRYDFSASYFLDDWIVSGSLGALYAERFNFADALEREQYNTNFVVTGEIWYQFEDGSIYLKGEAFSNYLLGVDPLAYTNKSSRFFEHPYGQITTGFILGL
ncbi:hypothetical protein N9D87_01560 [bacterium]|nr:hypothetical protein [bacterium]